VVTDENGDAQEKTRYMPFGGKRGEAAGITASNYLFTDQELDKESGLYNYDARMYDPVVGRFVSADSLVPYPNAPQSFNRYSYCVNNPLIYSDPTGHYYGGESGSDEDGHDDYDKDFGAYNDGQDISDYDKDYGYDVSRRHINPLPAGPNGPKISFINDVPTNPSPNQPVTHETAEMVESAVVDSGVKSVNINSTTGGKHSKNSRHSKGQAVDINTVNGISVKEKKNEKAVKDLQTSFNEEKNIRENFGPLINTKTSASGTRTDKPGMANSHQNHVHVSGQK
jgi:RHS repeat-associated protein